MTSCVSCQAVFTGTVPPACPSCGAPLGRGATSLRRGASILAPSGAPTFTPAPRMKLPVQVTLGIEIDRTGSSDAFRRGIATSSEVLLEAIGAKAKGLTVYVGTHGDLDYGEAPVLHTSAGTPEQALADIRAITYAGGGDAPEHHLDGILHFLQTVPWPMDSRTARGALVSFLTDESKPSQSGMSATEIGEAIRAKQLLFYAVCQPTPTLQELVRAANGMEIAISDAPDRAELQRAAALVAASIVATVGAGGTVPMKTVA
ncbi:MAG: hypothetical protein ABIT01_00220 [Thermoanaerobaculia bacterium]